MEFCVVKICKNGAQTLQKLRNGEKLCKVTKGKAVPGQRGRAPQASQTRPVLRTQPPLSLRDISPRSGESPHCVGRLSRGQSPRKKPPHQGRWPRVSKAGRALPHWGSCNFFIYHLDTTPEPCYSLTNKSVEGEKYRPTSAQRARRLVQAGTGTGRERTPLSCSLKCKK